VCNGATSCCNALRKVDLNYTSCKAVLNVAHRKTGETARYTLQFSSSLFRNGVARQLAEKIAQCNSTFRACLYEASQPGWASQTAIFVVFHLGEPGWSVYMGFLHTAFSTEISARRDGKIPYKHALLFLKEYSICRDLGKTGLPA